MATFTYEQLRDFERRRYKQTPAPATAVNDEGELHNEIFDYCRSKGWIPLHGSMAARTHRTEGEWDFTIVADNKRVFFIECKKKGGKVTTEQAGLIMQAARLGHTVYVVYSMDDFFKAIGKEELKVMKADPPPGWIQNGPS